MIKSIFEKIRHNHFLAMIMCCAIPLIAILTLSFFGILGPWGFYALMLLCPLLHLLMCRKSHASHCEVKAALPIQYYFGQTIV